MQRVPVALKLGYKGPRRRFLRHICGQVQEWLKFLILFFREYKVRACSNQFLHWQFILALLFYQVHVQFPPTCVEYIDKVSNFAGTDLQSGGEKVINFTVAFYLSHFYLRSVFFTGQQSGNRNVRYKKKTFYHFLLIWVNASLRRDKLSVYERVGGTYRAEQAEKPNPGTLLYIWLTKAIWTERAENWNLENG